MEERYIAIVDLGSGKIALSVAKAERDSLTVIYYKETPSDGILYSTVFNPKRASKPLGAAIREAESELNIKILQVVIGLPRYSVSQETNSAKLERTDPGSCIRPDEVEVLKSLALSTYPLDNPTKEEIYGAVTQSFSTDDFFQATEDDIIGTTSESISGNYKVFVGAKKAVANLDLLFNELGIAIARKYFLPDATAQAVLSEAEMDNGVALVEMGCGVTSLTIYQGGLLRFYGSIPFGGKSITADIKYECGFHNELAENIKLAYGACMPEKLQNMSDKVIQIIDDDNASYPELQVKYLSEIITAREREIFNAILYMIQESGYADRLRCGVVLTGGAANMVNCTSLLKDMSGYNVRLGFPHIRNVSHQGCPDISEMGAASVVGMLLKSREDEYLNCIEAAPQDDATDEEEGQAEGDTVFAPVKADKPEDRKPAEKKGRKQDKPRPPRNLVWLDKIRNTARNGFDSTVGSLFDGMSDN